MNDQFQNKLRRQKINVMLNEEERRIIIEKAIKYGYGDCLAEYIRAACIYENIFVEDVEGKTEVCDMVSKFIETLRKILHEQKVILRNVALSSSEVKKVSNQNKQIIEMIESLSQLIVATLSVNTEYKVQQRIKLLDKYLIDEKFLKKVTKNDCIGSVIRPSNLQCPSFKGGYLVNLKKYSHTFNLEQLDINEFASIVNNFRDIAMKKKIFLTFVKIYDELLVSIAIHFNTLDAADKFAEDIGERNICCILDQDRKMMGDARANNC